MASNRYDRTNPTPGTNNTLALVGVGVLLLVGCVLLVVALGGGSSPTVNAVQSPRSAAPPTTRNVMPQTGDVEITVVKGEPPVEVLGVPGTRIAFPDDPRLRIWTLGASGLWSEVPSQPVVYAARFQVRDTSVDDRIRLIVTRRP